MPKLTIDQREVEVPTGATILDAARKLGIEIPTLCHREGCEPSTSCLVCVVRVGRDQRLVPACATAAVDGMEVESESDAVRQVRRTALELLLSDHLGDCIAPCTFGCPAGMDIPTMLRQIAAGDMAGAIATVNRDIALPAVLGRICPAPCEKVCRRRDLDAAVSICLLKRLAADVDLASAAPYDPACESKSGKCVAIVGAGPAGLAAAYYLRRLGHDCTLVDENAALGGRLRHLPETDLPQAILDAEIGAILRLGVTVQLGTRIDWTNLSVLQREFDAVLLACGTASREQAIAAGLPISQRGIEVEPGTYRLRVREDEETPLFAAGNALRTQGLVVRSVADGKEAALAIDRFLSGESGAAVQRPFNTKIGRMDQEELVRLAAESGRAPRRDLAGGAEVGYTREEGAEQAARCLHCDCRGLHSCKLREWAAKYHADPRRYEVQRRTFQIDFRHADLVYESGKCIDCGLCVQIAEAAGEPFGLTFVGRGFDVRVSPPFDRPLADALFKAAAESVAACPTGALAYKMSLNPHDDTGDRKVSS